MKLPALKFDTPNNAATSLAIITELVRRGELVIEDKSDPAAPKRLDLSIYDVRERAKRG